MNKFINFKKYFQTQKITQITFRNSWTKMGVEWLYCFSFAYNYIFFSEVTHSNNNLRIKWDISISLIIFQKLEFKNKLY